jgi:hypothetical protein
VRRTDGLPAAAVLAVLLCALAAPPASAAEPGSTASGSTASGVAVERGFAAYKSALVRRDGDGAAATVSRNSLAYYDRMRGLALFASRSELAELEGTERMLVLALRHQAPRELLANGAPEALVAHAVDAGLVSDTGIARTELGQVTVHDDRARCWIVVDGQPTRGVLQFALEDGRWKFDLEFAMQSSAGLIAALANEAGMSEDEVILELLTRGSGKPVGPDIWQPLSED